MGIELLIGADIFYEMFRSDRRKRPGNYPFLQETVLGWTRSGRTPATTTQHDPHHTFLHLEDNSLEQSLNCFWEVKPVEESNITKEQQACEQHFITHTTQQNMEDLLSDCQQRWIPSNLGLFASVQSDDYLQLNVDWNKNSRITTNIS